MRRSSSMNRRRTRRPRRSRPLAASLLVGAIVAGASSGERMRAAAAEAPAGAAGEEVSTFFVGRLEYGGDHGTECGDVGLGLVRLVSKASTIEVDEEKRLRLTDPALFETPFVFMNGHDDFVFSDAELERLRGYLERGGFVFASGCCTNPEFPAAWRREFDRVFPDARVAPIPYDHPIYRSFYDLERLRSHNGDRDLFLEGLLAGGELVAVLGEDGLCCAFAMGGVCNRDNGIYPEDAQKIALNIAVYALTH